MYKIGDFSKLAQVSVKTLRYYGELGLLEPAWIDRYTGYRYYTAHQLPRLNRILALKDLGFSLDQIDQMLSEDLSRAELRGLMRLKQAELENKIQLEQGRLKRVARRLEHIEDQGSMPDYEVILKTVSPLQVIGFRRTIPAYHYLPTLFEEMHNYLHARNLLIDPASLYLAIYYDREFRNKDIDVEIAAPYPHQLDGMHSYEVRQLPGVEKMASTVYQGDYELIGDAYQAMMTWVETHGFQVNGSNRELYYQSTHSEKGHLPPVTEIQVPVQQAPKNYFISKDQESLPMEPKIVKKPAFNVVGMPYDGKNEHDEIKELWGQFVPRIPEIQDISGGSYGICNPAREDGSFRYLACMEVSATGEIPSGMEAWQVAAQQYAVFPCTLPTIRDTYKYAFESWLPGSGYTYTKGQDFEYYDDDFDPQVADSRLYIYIPVEK